MTRIVLFLLIFCLSATVWARWAKMEDLAAGLDLEHVQIDVRADGTYSMNREIVVLILNDQGRESESVQTIPFNARASTVKILSAFTETNGKKTMVPASGIEFRETGEAKSFDVMKQAILTFPRVQKGSRLHLRYRIDNKEVAFQNQFGFFIAPDREYLGDFDLKIRSPMPLKNFVWDLEKRYEVSSGKSGKSYWQHVRSKQAIFRSVVQEEYPFFIGEHYAMFAFSNVTDWKNFAPDVRLQVDRLLREPLPKGLPGVLQGLNVEKDEPTQFLNTVTSRLAEEFRYFGDWRRRKGGVVPRKLSEIVESHYGDCKDLSLLLVAILRSVGLEADMAWIWRGEMPIFERLHELPFESLFNHAITRVKWKDKIFWLDPTNPFSFAQGIPHDIADRPAFVVRPEQPFLDHTPSLSSADRLMSIDLKYQIEANAQVLVSGVWKFIGADAIWLTVRRYFSAPEVLNYDLIRQLTLGQPIVGYKIEPLQEKSRVVADREVRVRYRLADIGLRTTAGFGLPLLREDVVDRLLVQLPRVSDLYLSPPGIKRTQIETLMVKRIGRESMDCDIDSSWVRLTRKVGDSSQGVVAVDTYETKKSFILADEMNTPQFKEFQTKVRECFYRGAIILQRR